MKTIKLFFILLFFVAGLVSLSSCKDDEPENPDTHEWVDLGLPSGTLWATCNVGASSPEDYGDYFAWGETSPKKVYSNDSYKWSDYSKYNDTDNKTELDFEDDAAYVNWGYQWRMPSIEQINELFDSCDFQWTERDGVKGQLLTGPNGNTLFLPAAGYFDGNLNNYAGRRGQYWSRTSVPGGSIYDDTYYSDGIGFSDSWVNCGYLEYRTCGLPVRAVRVSPN